MKQAKKIILASQSPRRSEILKNAGYQFVPFPYALNHPSGYVSEIPNKNLSLNEQILDIARRKAEAAIKEIQDKGLVFEDSVILTADTMVCFNSTALGKPENEDIAFEYLNLLSGNQHQVKTAIYLIDLNSSNLANLDLKTKETMSHIETTHVFFRKISRQEIRDYISTKEPLDKAGAYAIQGVGRQFVEKYEGDFNNVVGLPLQAIEKLFRLNGWDFLKAT